MSAQDQNNQMEQEEAPKQQETQRQQTKKEAANVEGMKAELLSLELEAKRLEVAEKHLNLEDIQQRIDERKLKRETIRQVSLTNGATLKSEAEIQKKVERRCNHRKGGNGAAGIIGGQGDSLDYAVIKHVMLNGDTWVRCQRCGCTWKPPIREDFQTEAEYLAAAVAYETAKVFPTKNSTSSSYQFRFSDNGAYFREVMRNTTLR